MASVVTGFFDDSESAKSAISDLEAANIPVGDITLIASNADAHWNSSFLPARDGDAAGIGASIGGVVGGGAGLLTGLGMFAVPGVGAVVAAGWLTAAATGFIAGAAAGSIIAVLVEAGLSARHAQIYAEGVRRGGNLVAVWADDALAATVEAILRRNGAVDPDEREARYREDGWTSSDDEDASSFVPRQGDAKPVRYTDSMRL